MPKYTQNPTIDHMLTHILIMYDIIYNCSYHTDAAMCMQLD